jgi:hypothetical protein
MWRGADMLDVLRLVVLLSVCNGGLPRKQYEAVRAELLAAYGHEQVLALLNLERAGLLRQQQPQQQPAKANLAAVRRAFRWGLPAFAQGPQVPPLPPAARSQHSGPALPAPAHQSPGTCLRRRLLSGEEEELSENPSDAAHLHRGYAPLSTRLVEAALGPAGWAPVKDALAVLPGPHFDVLQQVGARAGAGTGLGAGALGLGAS